MVSTCQKERVAEVILIELFTSICTMGTACFCHCGRVTVMNAVAIQNVREETETSHFSHTERKQDNTYHKHCKCNKYIYIYVFNSNIISMLIDSIILMINKNLEF